MMIGMLVAGIGCLLAGLVAIGFGIPINEFGLGNTLILAGTVAACSGLIILSLWVGVRELKSAGSALVAPDLNGVASSPGSRPPLPFNSDSAAHHSDSFDGETSVAPPSATSSAPWAEGAVTRDRPHQDVPPVPEAAKTRRNLMFSSSSRKERERSQARGGETPDVAEVRPAAATSEPEASEAAPANFDDAWPKSERLRPPDAPVPRRPARPPSTASETPAVRPPSSDEARTQVTVLKSGVVDGMAYSLYSDGSIEAQMPEGLMRFASIDELRTHLDNRS